MIIVNAVWEKRNLGVDVVEITCTDKDNTEELRQLLSSIETPYSVLKIPSGCTDLLVEAQNCGFQVIENGIELLGDLRKIKVPDVYSRFIPHIRLEEAKGKILDNILGEIRRGEIFKTDRIAVDPYFSKEIAGKRYYNWCNDALEDGAFMGVLYYKDTPVAFGLSKRDKNDSKTFDGILGGLLPEASNKGLGFLVVYGENEICRVNEGKYCIGRVSSNNIPILRLHLQFGYEVKSMNYVLVKHN